MENETIKKRHSLTLENRAKGSMTGISEVLSYGENELCLNTSEGLLTLTGKQLKIIKYNTEDGSLAFSGSVDAVKYNAKKPPIIKRIFK